MSRQPKKPTAQQWLKFKSTIHRLYILQDIELKNLSAELEPLGLFATANQLEHQLKKWGMMKNIDGKTWRFIGHAIKRREQQGKESEVIRWGKRVEQSTISKGVSKHFNNMNIFDRFNHEQHPPSPPKEMTLAVCTPQALTMEFQWPDTLPWFEFTRRFLDISGALNHSASDKQQISGSVSRPEFYNSFIPWDNCTRWKGLQDTALQSVSKFAADIGLFIPEAHPGEHLQAAQLILTNVGSESLPELLKMFVYQLSNALTKSMSLVEIEAAYDLLHNLGFLSASIDFEQLRNQSLTIRAFTDNLLQMALYGACGCTRFPECVIPEKIEALVKRLLPSCRDFRILNWSQRCPGTALEFAIESRRLEMINLCLTADPVSNSDLSRGAGEAIFCLVTDTETPFVNIQRCIRDLLETDHFTNLEWLLHAAIKMSDHDLIEETIKSGADPCKRLMFRGTWKQRVDHDTSRDALATAASVDKNMVLLILRYLSIQYPVESPEVFVSPEAFVSAALIGDVDVISILHDISPDGFQGLQSGLTLIEAAVSRKQQGVVEFLSQLYGAAQPRVVLAALRTGNLIILRFLIHNGADLKGFGFLQDLPSDSTKRQAAFQIMIDSGAPLPVGAVNMFVKKLDFGSLKIALDAGGNPNLCDESGRSPLSWAMKAKSYVRLLAVELLLVRRARLRGGEVLKALQDRHHDLLITLMRHGAVLDPHNDSAATFEAAVLFRRPSILQFVIERLPGYYHPRPLCAAVAVENSDLVDLLLANRPRDALGALLEGTAVGLAARTGDITLLRKLLVNLQNPSMALLPRNLWSPPTDYSCNSGSPWWHGETMEGSPLALAISSSNTDGFSELLKFGYTPDNHTWEMARISGMYLQILIENDQHLEISEENDQRRLSQSSNLRLAIWRQDEQLVKVLLEAGVDVGQWDLLGYEYSPLQKAVMDGNLTIVDCLLQAGADVNVVACFCDGMTALQCAATRGYMGLAKHLLELGARVNARGSRHRSRTALETAAQNGRLDMLQLLLSNGAIITGAGQGQLIRSVYFAEKRTHSAAAQFLRNSRKWTDEDETLLQALWHSPHLENILPEPCCDEVHGSEDECIYDYTEEEEREFYSDYPELIGRSRYDDEAP
ncbi:hypothetical protein FGRMN_2803 [Fusarium graminum]|nr:hypothetical protein FGRMN_2803 [Fusarium graminum]